MSRNLHAEAIVLFPYNTGAGFDYKAWAKRILWREESGDKDLTAIQLKFAREAMSRGPEDKK
jgi:hypothetical protein